MSSALMLHVFSASAGLASGLLAMIFRKGRGLHAAAGSVFVVSMIAMSLSGAYLAASGHFVMGSVVGGLLTFYLVVTSWRAARRKQQATDAGDVLALAYIVLLSLVTFAYGIDVASRPGRPPGGIPAAMYFIFGTAAAWCAMSDVIMLKEGGVNGTARIRRHLWRMCNALLIALLSFYPGQGRLFPSWLRETNVLIVPHLLLVAAMIFWMLRLRQRRGRTQAQVTPAM